MDVLMPLDRRCQSQTAGDEVGHQYRHTVIPALRVGQVGGHLLIAKPERVERR
jgi:hypothetical protein